MPIYDIVCDLCGQNGEVLAFPSDKSLSCPACGSTRVSRLMSATSSLAGRSPAGMPGPGDHGCCGSRPAEAGCAGPGSCCGKTG